MITDLRHSTWAWCALASALGLVACSSSDLEPTRRGEQASIINPEGCADGTREGFVSLVQYPLVAACAGAWSLPGIAVTTPACGRAAGNSGQNALGTGCQAADLCAAGWHICKTPADFGAASPTGCTGAFATAESPSFFASAQSGHGFAQCTADGNNDLFGCGQGVAPANADNSCAPLNATSGNLCSNLSAAWACGTDGYSESLNVTKTAVTGGGVICCIDPLSPDAGTLGDAATDTGTSDAALVDAPVDAPSDAVSDASSDVGVVDSAIPDGAVDAALDAPTDAEIDASADANGPTDAAVDARAPNDAAVRDSGATLRIATTTSPIVYHRISPDHFPVPINFSSHGATTITDLKVHFIWLGNLTSAEKDYLTNLAEHISDSPYFRINDEYMPTQAGVTHDSLADFDYAIDYVDPSSDAYLVKNSGLLKHADVQTLVQYAVEDLKKTKFIDPEEDGLYLLVTDSSITEISDDNSQYSCSNFCAWHTSADLDIDTMSTSIHYGWIGSPASFFCGNCLHSSTPIDPNVGVSAESMASALVHEIEGTMSDPVGDNWYSSEIDGLAENADLCAWTYGVTSKATTGAAYNQSLNGANYLIQQNWDVNKSACDVKASPPPKTLPPNPCGCKVVGLRGARGEPRFAALAVVGLALLGARRRRTVKSKMRAAAGAVNGDIG